MKRVLIPTVTIVIILFISGCAKHEQALKTSKRAKLITEIIIDNESCRALKDKLTLPSIDDDGIERVYFDALKAGCIHKDV